MDRQTDLETQRRFWDQWLRANRLGQGPIPRLNAETRERAERLLELARRGAPTGAEILEVGCGTGWLAAQMRQFGQVTGLDLSMVAIEEARRNYPGISFIGGDFESCALRPASFDILVAFEVLAHIDDQCGFLDRCADLLRPGGRLLLVTQNRFVYERREDVAPLGIGQVRKWTSRAELRSLLRPRFRVIRMRTVTPRGHQGILRFVNSHRLNRLAEALGLAPDLDALRERLGFGTAFLVEAGRLGEPSDGLGA